MRMEPERWQNVRENSPSGKPSVKACERLCSGKYDGKISKLVADFALELLEVDRYGLDQTDRKILEMIIHKFNGESGEDWILWAAAIGEDVEPSKMCMNRT